MTAAIYTVGHSTRSADELVALLRDAHVEVLVDVRRFPASRRHPQHNRGALERTLPEAGISYVWHGEVLGGRRKQEVPTERSRNNAWEVPAFRYYADAMLNGLKFDRHAEEMAVATFARSLRTAANEFLEDPSGLPPIPNWNRVVAAIPEFFDLLLDAVDKDARDREPAMV